MFAVRQYFDITIFPDPEPTKAETPKKRQLKKWKFPWRIVMLAKPKIHGKKYEPPPPRTYKVFGPLDRATTFRADHLSRPIIRYLSVNKGLYSSRGIKYVKKVTKLIEKSWDSIYNYYNKKLRERKLKRLRRKLRKLKEKKPKGKALEEMKKKKAEHLSLIAQPKKPPEPEKIPRQRKPLEDLMAGIDKLALPVEKVIVPPREIGKVSSKALTYEITENIMKLYHIPDRLKRQVSEPHMVVKKSALRAKCTPRIEKLAQPSFSAREAKKHDEDKYDPWEISKNALKYKPTARILELAKPLERD